MNSNSRVFIFVSIVFISLFALSLQGSITNISTKSLNNINLLSEIFPTAHSQDDVINTLKSNINNTESKEPILAHKDFQLYQNPNLITNFATNALPALPTLVQKLHQLKNGAAVKIRIAYFGDSMIEGDLITQTLRELLQQEYGGKGVGYLPIASKVAHFRQTATTKSTGFKDISFKTKEATNLYLSGHYFLGTGTATLTDNTFIPGTEPIEKSILVGPATENDHLVVNAMPIQLQSNKAFSRIVLNQDSSNTINIQSKAAAIIYGVTIESKSGVFLDNFSFRGITGVELNKIEEDFFKAIQQENHYDLVVLQYGVNLLFRPNDKDYSYYEKMISPVLGKIKNSFNNADVLIMSSADRAFRYDGQYKSAIGLPNLIELQAKLAYDYGFSFFNLFQSMGGTNSIVDWAHQTPALANKDYIHPNHGGAKVIGKMIFDAIQADFKKHPNNAL